MSTRHVHKITASEARRPVSRGGRPGFTLLEVLIAVTIFALLGVIILSTFRTGTRAYEDAERQATLVDQARFVFDQLERDVHGSMVLDENEYNKTLRRKIDDIQNLMLKYNTGQATTQDVQNATGVNLDPRGNQNSDQNSMGVPTIGNPFGEGGIPVDLGMYGEPSGNDAKLSFVDYTPIHPESPFNEWGLVRVTYTSKDGVLVRETAPVQEPAADLFGQLLEKPAAPKQEILAQGVKRFSLRFGYWFDDVWLESGRWNSTRKEFRNSFFTWTPDPNPDKADEINQVGSQAWQRYQTMMNQAPYDDAPAYVRVTLVLADIKNPKRTDSFTTIIRFPMSQETYVPNTILDDDRKDAELEARQEGTLYHDNSNTGLGVGSGDQYQ